MTDPYLRLATAPGLTHPGAPSCAVCAVETDFDGDSWLCPSCGTAWPAEVMESDGGDATLFPDWSGEELTGPYCPEDLALLLSHEWPLHEREARLVKLLAARNETGRP